MDLVYTIYKRMKQLLLWIHVILVINITIIWICVHQMIQQNPGRYIILNICSRVAITHGTIHHYFTFLKE